MQQRVRLLLLGLIVAVVMGLMFVEIAAEIEQAKAWCESYNGTITSEKDLLMCQFENGTTVPLGNHTD